MEVSDVHKNSKVLIGGVPYNVEDADFMKPGKGRAIYRFKFRNLVDGTTLERTYHSGERIDEAQVSAANGQFLYHEANHLVFMNTETFEQLMLPEEQLGERKKWLMDGMAVSMLMLGDRLIDVTLPNFVELKVVNTEAATKTATITPQSKSAELESGVTIDVPSFIKEGDMLKVDTRTGTYVERVSGRK